MALLTTERARIVRRLTGASVRVTLGELEVTDRCVAADDEYGWCTLLVSDAAGKRTLDLRTGRVAAELCTGEVAFVWCVQQKRHVWQWVWLRLMDHSWLLRHGW